MVGGFAAYPFRGIVLEVVGNFLPIFSATERRCFNSEAQIVGNSVERERGRTSQASLGEGGRPSEQV